jgi:hypothetical protein
MRVATVLVIAVTGLTVTALTVAGCGQHGQGPGTPVVAKCLRPVLTTSRTFTVTDTDNGKTFCVGLNTGIYVFLHSTPAKPWSRPAPGSARLTPRPSGVFTLARGVTGAYFGASGPGTVRITSARPPCRAASSGKGPQCSPLTFFTITLLIRGAS